MKKIVGLKHEGGMTLNKKIDLEDEQLEKIIGKRGLRKLAYQLKKDIIDINLGKNIGIPAEQALEEMQEMIDKAILEQNSGI